MTEQLRWIIKKHGHNVTVLFCRSLGLGDVPAPPGLTLRIYNITRQAGCQALAALLPARRDTIERQGESRAPSLPFEGCKRAPAKRGRTAAPRAAVRARGSRRRGARRPTDGAPPDYEPPRRDMHPRPRRSGQAGVSPAAISGARARRELPPQESGNDKKAGTNDHHPARHLGGVGIKSRQRPHPSQGTLVPVSRRPHPPNDDAAPEAARRAQGFARSENPRRSGWQQRRNRQLVYLI